MQQIFINYRTEDAGPLATLLARELREALVDDVFLDHDDIVPGQPWPPRLREALAASHVVLALFGDGWLTAREPDSGRRRIDLPDDWVRQELETAKALGIPVIPLRVEGVKLPHADWLPEPLRWLPFSQALPLRRTELRGCVDRLVECLVATYGCTCRSAPRSGNAKAEDLPDVHRQQRLSRHEPRRPGWFVALATLAVSSIAAWYWFPGLGRVRLTAEELRSLDARVQILQESLLPSGPTKKIDAVVGEFVREVLQFKVTDARRSEARSTFVAGALQSLVSPDLSTDQLGVVLWVLDSLGRSPERSAFFARAGRPITGVSPTLPWRKLNAGMFAMGAAEGEPGSHRSERPVHQVRVGAFEVWAHEVTNEDLATFDSRYDAARRHDAQLLERWPGVTDDQLRGHPAVKVSWWTAYAYCAWIGGRLPTEAEWEYACRAGTSTPFAFGQSVSTAQVNYDGTKPCGEGAVGDFRKRTVPSQSLPANPWGLFEMHGNVWEWCVDTHGLDLTDYRDASEDGTAKTVDGDAWRVARGGGYSAPCSDCRSATRNRWASMDRLPGLGFRPVRSAAR